jgi:hypothetical protein
VANESGQVSLTQLNPMDTILLEIASMGCLLRPSATTGAKCDTQFTHASFTRCPPSLTIHLELVLSETAIAGLVWEKMIIRKDTRGRKEKQKSRPIFWLEYAADEKEKLSKCYLDRNWVCKYQCSCELGQLYEFIFTHCIHHLNMNYKYSPKYSSTSLSSFCCTCCK